MPSATGVPKADSEGSHLVHRPLPVTVWTLTRCEPTPPARPAGQTCLAVADFDKADQDWADEDWAD